MAVEDYPVVITTVVAPIGGEKHMLGVSYLDPVTGAVLGTMLMNLLGNTAAGVVASCSASGRGVILDVSWSGVPWCAGQ